MCWVGNYSILWTSEKFKFKHFFCLFRFFREINISWDSRYRAIIDWTKNILEFLTYRLLQWCPAIRTIFPKYVVLLFRFSMKKSSCKKSSAKIFDTIITNLLCPITLSYYFVLLHCIHTYIVYIHTDFNFGLCVGPYRRNFILTFNSYLCVLIDGQHCTLIYGR